MKSILINIAIAIVMILVIAGGYYFWNNQNIDLNLYIPM